MELIHCRGLNCYHDCVVSIANHFGINYPAAFSGLWSETDFRYDSRRGIYLTKRMISNLWRLGARFESFDCDSQEDRERMFETLHEVEFFIVGMDAFYIPWNQFYGNFHGPHYFVVYNTGAEVLPCYDPTYGRESEQISRCELLSHVFDICRMSRTAKTPIQFGAESEALEITRTLWSVRKTLSEQINGCAGSSHEEVILFAKYIGALTCNRWLYRTYLEAEPSLCPAHPLFFENDYFSAWETVKNGLYKIAVSGDKKSISSDVCAHFSRIIDREIDMAEKIAASGL